MSKNKGKIGEQLFASTMAAKGYKVVDVSNNPDYWHKDIDFIITSSTTGITKTFEVKWDYWTGTTGNIFIETDNIHSKGGQGWFKFCQADVLAYGDANNKKFYMIDMQKLREHLFWNKYKIASCGNESTGLIVPLAALKDFTQELQCKGE